MFRVGQKVVCVDASGWRRGIFIYPEQGEKYTVRDVEPNAHGVLCIRVEEISQPAALSADMSMYCEPLFRASRFRPLIEKKTDISIFTAMLNPSKRRVEA